MKAINTYMSALFKATLVFLLFTSVILFTSSCNDDDPTGSDPDPTENNESVAVELSSTDPGGTADLDGTSLWIPPNSIPSLANGQVADVKFTIEEHDALPKSLPSGMERLDAITHFGPEGFIFQEPLWLTFKLPENIALDQVSIVGFLPDTQDYGVFPMTYYDPEAKIIGTSVYELGYYFLANVDELNRQKAMRPGGFKLDWVNTAGWYPNHHEHGWSAADTYYKLVVTNFSAVNQADQDYWANYDPNLTGGRRYWEFQTPPQVDGWKPNHVRGISVQTLPQGTYTARLIASHKANQSDFPECKIYTLPLTWTISGSLTCDYFGCEGYDEGPSIPSGGLWEDFDCLSNDFKPTATVPVCTGEFQATLTWHNGEHGDTDLDLHLKGPNNIWVYYDDPGDETGKIILDRDVISDPGPVQENICAQYLDDMPSGEYQVLVNHYDGQEKSFQVRVIRGNNSSSYQGSLSPGDPDKLITTFTIE